MINKITDKLNIDVKPELITVKNNEEAIKHRHIGGPTIHVNGLDIEPEAREIELFGMA